MSWYRISTACIGCIGLIFSCHFGVQDASAQEPVVQEILSGQPANMATEMPSASNEAHCDACQCTTGRCGCGKPIDWTKVPGSLRPLPPLGFRTVAPKDRPGYFNAVDQLKGCCREKRQPNGYPSFALMGPSFFDADWRFVEGINWEDRTFVEKLKRMPLTDNLTFNTGGQVWSRLMNENNSRLTETDNNYLLSRIRTYGDLMYGDRFRFYTEFIWADSFWEDLAPLPIDANRGDLLNMFVDVKLTEINGGGVYARIGRQELLLGSQRLVSSLDWGNTRRTFEGVRVFNRGKKWDFDLFYTNFVPPVAGDFDQADERRKFAGAWLTYKPKKGSALDFYYLYSDNDNNVTQQGIVVAPTETNTIGSRFTGATTNGFLYETELALQFGKKDGADLFAGAGTAGLGRKFKNGIWSPTLWAYYDYASGDPDPNSGDAHTFNQLYPFGHYYLGWLDQVARQNIHDVNLHLHFHPTNWITILTQYHHFWLNHGADALYNAGGVAIRRDPTGTSGTDLGDEIDLIFNFHMTRYSDVMLGYSKLYGGSFLTNTRSATAASNAEFFHLMYQRKF